MLKTRHLRHPVRAARSAEQLLRLHVGAFRRARDGKRTYKNDPRFRLDLVEQGFRSRHSSEQCDEELLHRICEAYKAASCVPVAEAYRPTAWWDALRRSSLQPVIQALETRDIDALQRMYANFFRERCSDGLVGKTLLLAPSLSRPFARLHQLAYLSEALSRLDAWKDITNARHALQTLSGPAIGNPFGIVLEGVLIRPRAEHQYYCAERIGSVLNDATAVIAEIGGGYGGMAYYLLRDHSQVTYLNFDLPESLALAAYYLMKSFPEKRFLLYGETSTRDVSLRNFDVVLLPLSELSAMPSASADLIFSSHAMSDLDPAALSVYMAHANDIGKRYFLYQGMYRTNGTRNHLECPGFALKEEKRFTLSGQNGRDDLLWELLYEKVG